MIAFDADVLTDILSGQPMVASRAAQIPADQQVVPIIVIEELLRGRLHAIRQAEAGKSTLRIERSYGLLEETLAAFRQVTILTYSPKAEALYRQWRGQKLRVGTHDLRIAASCVVASATLVTRNRRDFEQVPGLSLEIWE